MEAKKIVLNINYTPLDPGSSSETLTITEAELPDNIDVTASSNNQSYVLDRTNGLELDYSGVTASSSTTTFVWGTGVTHEVKIVQGSTLLATLGPNQTSFAFPLSCRSPVACLDLLVGEALLNETTDPKIKIVPPMCPPEPQR